MIEKYNILLVDDHQIILDGLRGILTGTNFNVVAEATNGQQALDIIMNSNQGIDIVLTDISMPYLSGIDLCMQIKEEYNNIKVLILSMYDTVPIIKEALSAEADGFVLKNICKEELLLALNKIMNDGHYYSKEIVPILVSQSKNNKYKNQLLVTLSNRELEILKLIIEENSSEQISKILTISKKTVDNHRANILLKTGYKSTIGLVKFAIQIGIE